MNIKERVEQNVIIWLLGTLVTGFTAGWGAFSAISQITKREVKSEVDLRSAPACDKFGVTITQRKEKVDKNENVFISGTVESLPPEYEIWIVAIKSPGSSGYYPRGPVNIKGNQWELEIAPGLKSKEDQKRFAAYVVGKNGQDLFKYYKSTMKPLVPDGEDWPPLTFTTLDMDQCKGYHEVSLK